MKRALVAVLLALAACSSAPVDSPEVAAKKAACRALLSHVYRVSPEAAAQFAGLAGSAAQAIADQLVAALPAEDIDQCVAADAKVIGCMQRATDIAGVKHCVPAKSSAGD